MLRINEAFHCVEPTWELLLGMNFPDKGLLPRF
jgi:hypothetical protein